MMPSPQRWQFSIRRLLAVTAICAVLVAATTSLGFQPVVAMVVTAASICLGAFILLTGPTAWTGLGAVVVGAIAGCMAGGILYRSPLPGAAFGSLAALIVFLRVRRHEPINRRKALASSLIISTVIGVLPLLVVWRHHRAEYVIGTSGVSISRSYPYLPRRIGMDNFNELMRYDIPRWLGPYIIAPTRAVYFVDIDSGDPAIVMPEGYFNDDKLAGLKPHFDSIQGVDKIRITSDTITDQGLAQLVDMPGVRSISLKSNLITSQGLHHLEKMTSLESVSLSCPQVDNDAIEILRNLPKLQTLTLGETQISEAAVREFATFPNLQKIIVRPSTTPETLAVLSKAIAPRGNKKALSVIIDGTALENKSARQPH